MDEYGDGPRHRGRDVTLSFREFLALGMNVGIGIRHQAAESSGAMRCPATWRGNARVVLEIRCLDP